MKNLIAILICLGIASFALAQKMKTQEVPQVVRAAFAKAYPNVKNMKWEKEGDSYEADFDLQREETSALFDAAGKMKEVETEIAVDAMPVAVKKSLTKDYADYKVKEAAKIVAENVITYEAEVKKGRESFDLIFSEDGNLVKKKVKNKKD